MAFLEYFRDDKSEHNDEWKTVYWKNVLFILKMFSWELRQVFSM